MCVAFIGIIIMPIHQLDSKSSKQKHRFDEILLFTRWFINAPSLHNLAEWFCLPFYTHPMLNLLISCRRSVFQVKAWNSHRERKLSSLVFPFLWMTWSKNHDYMQKSWIVFKLSNMAQFSNRVLFVFAWRRVLNSTIKRFNRNGLIICVLTPYF